jgi:hypothetical protein
MTDPDVQYLRSLASGYANSFINGWQTEYRHLNAIADRLESFMQAPSGQQAETDETWRRRAEHLDRELKAARVDVDSEIVEGQLTDFLLRFGGKYDGNGMWDVSLYLEDICQVMSALARQQSERPAESKS